MKNGFLNLNKTKIIPLIIAMIAFPACAFSDTDFYVSKLNNRTNGKSAFNLVQDKVLSEQGCIVDSGSNEVQPGKSTLLKVKKGCTWGVVTYKILKGSKKIGILTHDFRDGDFSIEIKMMCKGGQCNFYDLSSLQDRKK